MAKSNPESQTTNIAVMQTDIGYIKKSVEGIEAQLKLMDNNYVKREDFSSIEKDHELRLRRLETWGFSAIGGLAVIEFALNYFK